MSSIIFINCEKCKTVLLKPFRASARSILIRKEYDKWFHKIAGDVLVDGGVADNQGIESLLEDPVKCNMLLVSDASGQMEPMLVQACSLNQNILKQSA